MANPVDDTGGIGSDDDTLLTAWLDGELTPEDRAALDRRLAAEPTLVARLEELRRADRPYGPAYDALLAAAPADRLNAMLAGLLASGDAGVTPKAASRMPRGWMAAAAAVVLLAIGGIAGYAASILTAPQPYLGWRQAVAEYHALISPETLAVISEDPAALAAELTAIGGKLELDLTPERLALPHAYLKRAVLYDYGGHPLVQLIYASPETGPFALCIIASERPDNELDFEERVGSNIVYWYKDGRGYMLIAKTATRAQLEAFAGDIAARFG